MKRAAVGFMVGFAVILQLSLLPALRLCGVVPNVLWVVVVLVAMRVATSEALVAALAAGAVVDVVSGLDFGLWMGVLMLLTLVAGLVDRAGLELPGWVVAAGLVSAGTAVMTLAIWSALIAAGVGWPMPASFGGRLVIEIGLNLMLTMVLGPLVQWVLSVSNGRRGMEGG